MSVVTRMPTIYLPHGGGPWPFVDLGSMVSADEVRSLAAYLAEIPASLPSPPSSIVVVSAHWEEGVPTVQTHPHPPMLYDYYGFPDDAYTITWPARGDPKLASRVREVLGGAGFEAGQDAERGFDHGTFVPLKVMFPGADVPTIQLSLQAGLDPERHVAMGRALAPLRDEGVLIVGSGMSYHNLGDFRIPRVRRADRSAPFDAWLRDVIASDPPARDDSLVRWAEAPSARIAHPREEHLLPLMVVAGAAGLDRGRVGFRGTFAGLHITAAHFGSGRTQEADYGRRP